MHIKPIPLRIKVVLLYLGVIIFFFCVQHILVTPCVQRESIKLRIGQEEFEIPRKLFYGLFVSPKGESFCQSGPDVRNAEKITLLAISSKYIPSNVFMVNTLSPHFTISSTSTAMDGDDPYLLVEKLFLKNNIKLEKLPIKGGFYECKKCGDTYIYPYSRDIYISADKKLLSPNGYPVVIGCTQSECAISIWHKKNRYGLSPIDQRRFPIESFPTLYRETIEFKKSLSSNP